MICATACSIEVSSVLMTISAASGSSSIEAEEGKKRAGPGQPGKLKGDRWQALKADAQGALMPVNSLISPARAFL